MTEDVFLLFEDTKKSHQGVSFSAPLARITARKLDDVNRALAEVCQWQKKGFYLAGYVAYEAGWAFMSANSSPQLPDYPLIDFYVFKDKKSFHSLNDIFEPVHVYNFKNGVNYEKYRQDLEHVFSRLRSGDTYQVNYTQRMSLESTGEAWDTYLTLRRAQRVEYAAYLATEELQVLSFSPELFIKKTGSILKTRPMKGTRARDIDPVQDLKNKEFLLNDEKNRAENVMIVDLLRNDMGKIAEPGSVSVTSLFQIEEYETVFQMVSQIECRLNPDVSFDAIFPALFPCGSITGAPKRSTMGIIQELETEPRGIYTGAIGFLEPNGDFCFNVAIRTLVKHKEPFYVFGAGGGILINSRIEDEHREMGLKARFLNTANDGFYLFESFLYDGSKFKSLTEHLSRLERSAAFFAFDFSLDEIMHHLQAITSKDPCRVRLSLWNDGRLQLETYALEPKPYRPEVVISSTTITSNNLFRRHKSSYREIYDKEYKIARQAGHYEILFLNERGEVAEASRHNVFVKKSGHWFTPPVESGALPGVEREQAIKDLKAQERVLSIHDLKSAQEIMLTNSVRGRVVVRLKEST